MKDKAALVTRSPGVSPYPCPISLASHPAAAASPCVEWQHQRPSVLYTSGSFCFGRLVLMCLCPLEDHLGWQSGCPFNTKAETETLSFGSSRRGCIRRRKRLGLKAGGVDETLDELFWPLLLLFYVRRTFHSKYCFYARVGEGDVNFSVGNMGRERIPTDHFLLPLDISCLVWKERISGCTSLYPRHSGAWCFYMRGRFYDQKKHQTSSHKSNYGLQGKQLCFHGLGGKGAPSPKCGLSIMNGGYYRKRSVCLTLV